MTRFTVRRLWRALTRFLLSVGFLLIAMEAAILWAGWQEGEDSRHVYGEAIEWLAGDVPASVSVSPVAEPNSWWRATAAALWESLKALGLASLLTLGLGPPLGIFVARFRRVPMLEVLFSPIFLAAFWPGFWIACLAIWWQVEHWGQPGFADTASGFRLWWQAFLIAVIVAPPAIAWQIRSIAWAIREAAKAGHVRGALCRGQSGSRLFYRHVFSSALDPVARCFDRVLPVMIGGQLFVEWALRYPGIGSLMIESARNGYFAGILAGGFAMSLLIVLCRFAGEVIYGASDRRGREGPIAAVAV